MHVECIPQILLCFAPCHAAHGRTLATFLFGRIDWQPIKRLKADKSEHAQPHTPYSTHSPSCTDRSTTRWVWQASDSNIHQDRQQHFWFCAKHTHRQKVAKLRYKRQQKLFWLKPNFMCECVYASVCVSVCVGACDSCRHFILWYVPKPRAIKRGFPPTPLPSSHSPSHSKQI